GTPARARRGASGARDPRPDGALRRLLPWSASRLECAAGVLVAEQPYFLAPVTREEMNAVDEAHPVATGAHHERVRARGIRQEADAAEEVAVRDTGGGHDHLAWRQPLSRDPAC